MVKKLLADQSWVLLGRAETLYLTVHTPSNISVQISDVMQNRVNMSNPMMGRHAKSGGRVLVAHGMHTPPPREGNPERMSVAFLFRTQDEASAFLNHYYHHRAAQAQAEDQEQLLVETNNTPSPEDGDNLTLQAVQAVHAAVGGGGGGGDSSSGDDESVRA